MKDKLEKYIREHKDKLDVGVPSNAVWESIEKELEEDVPKTIFNLGNLWKVAAIFFFGLSIYLLSQMNHTADDVTNQVAQIEDAEFKETENFYVSQISTKREKLLKNSAINPELVKDFAADIHQLDSIYQTLKSELKSENTEALQNALIQNLQLRMELLNQQLMILENVKNTNTHENISI